LTVIIPKAIPNPTSDNNLISLSICRLLEEKTKSTAPFSSLEEFPTYKMRKSSNSTEIEEE
jgi:hypothetical protein